MALNGFSLASAFDAAATPLALPVWLAGAVAAVFFFLCILAFRRAGALSALLWIVAGAVGALSGWTLFGSPVPQQRGGQNALEARNAELTDRALAPGSVLACLGGAAGDTIESACERKIFATPESAAAAVMFVTAQLSLLADAAADDGDPRVATMRANLKRAIGLDRYGIAAHVLETRDGCTPEQCQVFALLDDVAALKTNLKTHAFDNYVTRYAVAWGKTEQSGQTPVAEIAPAATPGAGAALPAPHAPVPSKYDFPSADSIPPVSIMNAEPKLPAASEQKAAPPRTTNGNEPAAKTAAAPQDAGKPPLPPHRPQPQAAAPASR